MMLYMFEIDDHLDHLIIKIIIFDFFNCNLFSGLSKISEFMQIYYFPENALILIWDGFYWFTVHGR